MTTELFEEIFHSGSSGSLRSCKCGRTYFDGDENDYDWEKGELKSLRKKARKMPDTYIEKDHSIQTMNVGVDEFVIDCQCNGAQIYENFINQHDVKIAKYLNKKSENLKEKANKIEVKH